jgi:hypothetical protein
MTEHSPITPSPELIKDWHDEWNESDRIVHSAYTHIAIRAAQWGADQELEACCDVLKDWGSCIIPDLRAARRPKPPSLKEQAQAKLKRLIALIPTEGAIAMAEPIRRALEELPDD